MENELKPETIRLAIIIVGSLTCIFAIIVKLIKRGDVKSFTTAIKDFFGGTDLMIISIEHKAFIYAMKMTKDERFIAFYKEKRQELISEIKDKKELRSEL